MSFVLPVTDAVVGLGVTKIALDSVTKLTDSEKAKKKGRKRSKYVVVSGRSSHTVTASDPEEAKKVFKRRFPYAHVRHVSKVQDRLSA